MATKKASPKSKSPSVSVRTTPGVTAGSAGAKKVNPLYAAARGVARYVGGAAREVRDIPTALGSGSLDEIKMQLKEAAAAVTAGQKGTPVAHTRATGEYEPGWAKRK